MNKVEENIVPLTAEIRHLIPGNKFRFTPNSSVHMILQPTGGMENSTTPDRFVNLRTASINEICDRTHRVFLVRSVTLTEED